MSDENAATPAIVEREAQPYAGIRRPVPEGVPAMVDEAFPELYEWLSRHGVAPAGPPILRCWRIDADGEPLLMEAGCPVAGSVPAKGEVRVDALPAGRYLSVTHVGPYRSDSEPDLGAARDTLLEFVEREGLVIARPLRGGGAELLCGVDRMLRSPTDTPDPADWTTEIEYLLDAD